MISIRKRIDTFLSDAGARSQYESVASKGQALHDKQHGGQPLEGADISDLKNIATPAAKSRGARFSGCAGGASRIQHSIQKYVSKTLELGRVPNDADLEEGSCGDGCGCHRGIVSANFTGSLVMTNDAVAGKRMD